MHPDREHNQRVAFEPLADAAWLLQHEAAAPAAVPAASGG